MAAKPSKGQPANATPLPPELKRLSKADAQIPWNEITAGIDRLFAACRADAHKPLWERLASVPSTTEPDNNASTVDSWVYAFVGYVRLNLDYVLESRGKQQARAKMAGCHAAICNYRWEHDSLPTSLDELKLGDMAIDPFTRQPFIYKPAADRRSYVLQCAGPPVRDEKNHIKPGEHKPFTLN